MAVYGWTRETAWPCACGDTHQIQFYVASLSVIFGTNHAICMSANK